MASKLLNLFALSSLAVLVCSFSASPVSALSLQSDHHLASRHGHGALAKKKRATGAGAKKKRSSTKRCKPKTTSTTSSTSTHTSTPTSSTSSSSKAAAQVETHVAAPAPSPTHSSAPAPQAAAPAPVQISGNAKVGFSGLDTQFLGNFVTKNTKFYYNWNEQCPNSDLDKFGIECMPMLWSDEQSRVTAFEAAVVPGYAKYILGFNECNEVGQSNMSPQDAAASWIKYIEPKKNEGFILWGPSTSSNPDGLEWYKQFLQACNGGCSITGPQIHYYDISADGMIAYLNLWHDTFGLPLIVTEFACQNFNTANENNGQQCSEDQVQAFYKGAIEFMESSDFVFAWFAFGWFQDMAGVNDLDRLYNNGFPTALGSELINLSF